MHVTGLHVHYTIPQGQKMTVGTGDNAQTFKSNSKIPWRVRWDYDPNKGPHVNAQFGTKPSTKFAYQLDSSLFLPRADLTNPDNPDVPDPGKAMQRIARNLNKQCKYERPLNEGKEGKPQWDTTEQQAIEDSKNYFKSVATGSC